MVKILERDEWRRDPVILGGALVFAGEMSTVKVIKAVAPGSGTETALSNSDVTLNRLMAPPAKNNWLLAGEAFKRGVRQRHST